MTDSRKDFRIIAHSKSCINRAIRILGNWHGVSEDAMVEVIVRPYRRNRTREQNSLYWKWMSVIERETGQDIDSLHEHYKGRFLARILVRDDAKYGEMSEAVKAHRKAGRHDIADQMRNQIIFLTSTSRLTTKQFTEYLDSIEHDVMEIGITLPQPEDKYGR